MEKGEIDTRGSNARAGWTETTCDECEEVILESEERYLDSGAQIHCQDCHSKDHFKTVTGELSEAFESFKRNNGKTAYKLKEKSADWIDSDLMREFHKALDDRPPSDWVYETVMHLASSFEDRDSIEDIEDDSLHEIVDSQVDIYYSDLTDWLASHNGNLCLVDEACEEMGRPDDTSKAIQYGQYMAIERIGRAMLEAIGEEIEERENSDDE